MSKLKVVSMPQSELKRAEESKTERERRLLEYVDTIEIALKKTGQDPLTVPINKYCLDSSENQHYTLAKQANAEFLII